MALLKTYGVLGLVGFPSEIKIHPASIILGNSLISSLKFIIDRILFCLHYSTSML
ncbi:hypothetical protein Sjap_005822 [Stephania japonica]|uniref:Uncharacterized protein n=1 Tax=Stephania japonica TaxID=461633 RepID=A0AAP0K6A3_9MAGN